MRGGERGEKGSVLITVLLLVAILAVLGVAVLDDIRFSMRRTANIRDRTQADYFALGAEQLALGLLQELIRARPNRNTLDERWAEGPIILPLDDGLMEAEVSDASNCFNINSLVDGSPRRELEPNEEGMQRYQRLLQALEFSENEAEELAATATDWIDTDGSALPQGGEDYAYSAVSPPYLTGNTLMAELSELRAVEGYTPDVLRRVMPFLCAHGSADPSELNVNTLMPLQAPLLVMLKGNDLSIDEAESIIAARPAGGFETLEAFWSLEAWAGKAPTENDQALVSLKTGHFALKVTVIHGRAEVVMSALLERRADGALSVVARRFGEVE